jgi:hypothetical protein
MNDAHPSVDDLCGRKMFPNSIVRGIASTPLIAFESFTRTTSTLAFASRECQAVQRYLFGAYSVDVFGQCEISDVHCCSSVKGCANLLEEHCVLRYARVIGCGVRDRDVAAASQ